MELVDFEVQEVLCLEVVQCHLMLLVVSEVQSQEVVQILQRDENPYDPSMVEVLFVFRHLESHQDYRKQQWTKPRDQNQ